MTIILRWDLDRKERKKVKNVFKTNVLVPKTNSMWKEEGATVAATPYLLLSKTVRAVLCFVGPVGQRFMETFKPSAGKSH